MLVVGNFHSEICFGIGFCLIRSPKHHVNLGVVDGHPLKWSTIMKLYWILHLFGWIASSCSINVGFVVGV